MIDVNDTQTADIARERVTGCGGIKMERLTERETSCWIRLKNGSEFTNYHKDWDAISKLAEYEDAEELWKG